ncbi:MAG: hypothetical protein LBS26_01955 [Campylobacteraceae bacterium]|jgi:alpha-tubulin suppressor-like RCC1 family protein|nr:hypothetical protein [Campylobacteraceae bacterium]
MLGYFSKYLTRGTGVCSVSSHETTQVSAGISASFGKIAKPLALASVLFLLGGCSGGGGNSGSEDKGGCTDRSYNIASVAAGTTYSLALASDGKVYVSGQNSVGQIGFDSSLSVTPFTNLAFFDDKDIVAISAGGSHSFALSRNGVVYASGENGNSQLGLDTTADQPVFIEVNSLIGKNITAISAGVAHSLAVDGDGALYVAGDNSNGRTGLSTESGNTNTFTAITDLSGVKIVAVSAGEAHSLAIDSDGKVYAAGYGKDGRTGLGTSILTNNEKLSFTAVPFPDGVKIVAVSAGYDHSLAIAEDGALYVAGDASDGRLGIGTGSNQGAFTKADITALSGKVIVAAAAGDKHSVILASDGRVYTAGANSNGRTGRGTVSGNTDTFIQVVAPDKNITAIAAGFEHSLVISDESVVYATGENGNGQLGHDGTTDVNVFTLSKSLLD